MDRGSLQLLCLPGSPLILTSAPSCVQGKCVASGTSYVCRCTEGYGGALCDQKNDSNSACSTFKCHQGQCHISDRGEPYCLCQPGFSGEHCEQGGSTVRTGGGPQKDAGGQSQTPHVSHGLSSRSSCAIRGYATLIESPAAAKSLQSCPTLCNPIDGSPPGSSIPGILQARTLQWVAISFSNA